MAETVWKPVVDAADTIMNAQFRSISGRSLNKGALASVATRTAIMSKSHIAPVRISRSWKKWSVLPRRISG